MCRWNPDSEHPFRRCRHGHRHHEELPIGESGNYVTWCNECWTVCAYNSGLSVHHGIRAVLSDIVYSPVHQTGEIFQGNVKTPSMSRYQTFRDFNRHREMQDRGLHISDPIPYRRNDSDLSPSFPPPRRSAEGRMPTPDMRKQLYDSPLGFIPRDPFSSPSQSSSSLSPSGRSGSSSSRGRSSRERSPIPPPVPPPLITTPSFDVAVDYRNMPLYRQQTSSQRRKARPNPPGPRPVQGTSAEDGSVSQYSVQSAYPTVSPRPEEGPAEEYISSSDFRQRESPPSRSDNQYGNRTYASAEGYRRSPIYSRPAEFDDGGYGYQQSQPAASSSSRPRERASPVQPGVNYGASSQRDRSRTQPRRNRYGWSSGLSDNLL